VWDSQSGGIIEIFLTSKDGSIVPKGSWALFAIDLKDRRLLVGHTTKFNEALDNQSRETRDDGACLAFSQYPEKIFRPTSGHSRDIFRQIYQNFPNLGACFCWGYDCLVIFDDGTCSVYPNDSYEPGFSAIDRTRIWWGTGF